jgi:DNA-binding response OmpR family regulator
LKENKLIIDDDKDMDRAIRRLLLLEGKYEIECIANGDEAGQKFMDDKPDLVILDIRMPRGDGYKLC